MVYFPIKVFDSNSTVQIDSEGKTFRRLFQAEPRNGRRDEEVFTDRRSLCTITMHCELMLFIIFITQASLPGCSKPGFRMGRSAIPRVSVSHEGEYSRTLPEGTVL